MTEEDFMLANAKRMGVIRSYRTGKVLLLTLVKIFYSNMYNLSNEKTW